MKMIVGLGNIGPQYDNTRHNTGFIVVDAFAVEHNIELNNRKLNAKFGIGMVGTQKVILVEPTTFMNESGRAVRPIMDYYDIDINDVIIVHDDMDLPVGKLRIKAKGSAGGHNGIKSLIDHLGTREFTRLKVGIGHPANNNVVDHVLGKFNKDEAPLLNQTVDQSMELLNEWVNGASVSNLANQFN